MKKNHFNHILAIMLTGLMMVFCQSALAQTFTLQKINDK